jgi:hypothetical protein
MKKVISLLAVLALFAQTAFAQLEVTPTSSTVVIDHSVSTPTPVVLNIKYFADVFIPPSGPTFGAYVQFTVTASSATGGATLTGMTPAAATPSTSKDVTVNIPPYSQAGTTFTVSITATNGVTPLTKTATITVASTLAVDLVSVNAKANQGKNLVTWSTATEKDNSKFVVERSVNGLNFAPIGEVKSVGTSQTVNNYSFSDANVEGSVNYYRIKAVDMAGKESTSKVVAVASKGTLAVNATRSLDGSKINIVSDSEGDATIHVYNMAGQVVANQVVNTTSGVSEHVLNLNQSGLFIVNVTKGQSTVSTKMYR